jgi:hypothetical protein
MAAVIGRTRGYNKNGAPKASEATRLAQGSVVSEANTWNTISRVTMEADGSGCFCLIRDKRAVFTYHWKAK